MAVPGTVIEDIKKAPAWGFAVALSIFKKYILIIDIFYQHY
ncbi:hypothetical protein L580_0148 [Serratia fonticola AU-P3(3)]|nr:hypothetical protein L580_0148 [Serratia fonticola AU-P3(3)]